MRTEFVIYDDAIKKLEEAKIPQRVDEVLKSGKFETVGHLFDPSDVVEYIKEIHTNGFFSKIPKEKFEELKNINNNAFQNIKSSHWTIDTNNSELKEQIKLEDILFFTGWFASQILKPEEVMDFQKYGFSSIQEWFGVVGAYLNSKYYEKNSIWHKGQRWKSEHRDGITFQNEVTGSDHYDFRMHQDDVTQYKVKDPMGDNTCFRPKIHSLNYNIAGTYGVESALLVSFLKYIDQCGIESEIMKYPNNLSEWLNSFGERLGGLGCVLEHLSSGPGTNPRILYTNFDVPIPSINDDYKKFYTHTVSMNSEEAYRLSVGEDNQLFFSINPKDPANTISGILTQNDADDFLKALFYQCAKKLGRTPLGEIENVFNHRFSQEFTKDRENWKKEMTEMNL